MQPEIGNETLKKFVSVLFAVITLAVSAVAQDHSRTLGFGVSFRQSSSFVDAAYRDNAEQFSAFFSRLDSLTGDGSLVVRKVIIHGTTSPEGTYLYNRKLSWARATNLKNYLAEVPALRDAEFSVDGQGIAWEQLTDFLESHTTLAYRDTLLHIIANLPETENLPGGKVGHPRLQAIKSIDRGKAYRDIFQRFFKQMRGAYATVTFVMVVPPVEPSAAFRNEVTLEAQPAALRTHGEPETDTPILRRLPLLAVKTNLLLDVAPFYPGYGWAPVPNVALEYFPAKGNWTVGASLDCPWWKDSSHHRYFQVRNYQLEARRYFNGVKEDYFTGRYRKPAYTGWFLSGYVHGGLYGIGLNNADGIQGEGVGAGIGAGYVFPLGRESRWRIELSLQAGYAYTWYDRYVYGNPVTGNENGLYYYNWTGHADDFEPRLYRTSWLGPTRAGIVISYDLFRRQKREVLR